METLQPQIVAMGGGLLSERTASSAMMQYVFGLTGKERPRILLDNTAWGNSPEGELWFYKAIAGMRCHPTDLLFFAKSHGTPSALMQLCLNQDIIFVVGGNTRSALAIWREYGLDRALKAAWEKGVVLAGSSAGAVCWFGETVSDWCADGFSHLPNCLEFLPGSCVPHYNGNSKRKELYHQLLLDGKIPSGYGVDECAALHLVGSNVKQAVTAKPGAGCYSVSVRDGKVVEEPLSVVSLL